MIRLARQIRSAMVRSFQNLVHQTDALLAGAYLSMFRERSALIAFLFHSLFLGDFEIKRNHVDPLQRTTVAEFRQLVEYYVRNGYRFISPRDILEGLTA